MFLSLFLSFKLLTNSAKCYSLQIRKVVVAVAVAVAVLEATLAVAEVDEYDSAAEEAAVEEAAVELAAASEEGTVCRGGGMIYEARV
ncbi:hypothetical protein L1987_60004 [Smallanthus sonchifolius]|uniref:Uncharacterized protein n=1 Tax=Smallanthus sonchifolius TaxID=185202 RepID=A0ACB9D6V0_9ASTR|nr:hypothetical protein L1987_60004 [Smallanthus sonchifolius]